MYISMVQYVLHARQLSMDSTLMMMMMMMMMMMKVTHLRVFHIAVDSQLTKSSCLELFLIR